MIRTNRLRQGHEWKYGKQGEDNGEALAVKQFGLCAQWSLLAGG